MEHFRSAGYSIEAFRIHRVSSVVDSSTFVVAARRGQKIFMGFPGSEVSKRGVQVRPKGVTRGY